MSLRDQCSVWMGGLAELVIQFFGQLLRLTHLVLCKLLPDLSVTDFFTLRPSRCPRGVKRAKRKERQGLIRSANDRECHRNFATEDKSSGFVQGIKHVCCEVSDNNVLCVTGFNVAQEKG